MKKKSGFTLIELLAVIVILGIIISLSTVAVANIKEKQEEKNRLNVISSILTGAKAYNADNKIGVDVVEVNTLKDNGYVDFDENEYGTLVNENVTKNNCGDNNLKMEYVFSEEFTRNDGSKYRYTDCGCEVQESGTSKTICEKDS